MKRLILALVLFLSTMAFNLFAQDSTSIGQKLISFAKKAARFSYDYTQEKVYLHFDNTGYFLGETIWFKAYVVKAENNALSDMSKTLYVDLLTPEGDIIENKKLRIDNGTVAGEFHLPDSLKGGFYEIRAYTRCMLNFGSEVVFSRVFPFFDAPVTEGNYIDRNMTYRKFTVPNFREKEPKYDKVNVSFFPEGGNLIVGTESKVAFKATDKQGQSIDVTGSILNSKGEEISSFISQHDGMGSFPIISDGKKLVAKVIYKDHVYSFNLPTALPAGVTMTTFTNSKENIRVLVQKSPNLALNDSLALVTTCRGRILNLSLLNVLDEGTIVNIPKNDLPEGVNQLTLYDGEGRILADRLVYIRKPTKPTLLVQMDKTNPKPYEKITMNLQAMGQDGTPTSGSFSLAVRDGASSDFGNSNNSSIQTELLLASDLKGYIENPAWYFAEYTTERLYVLDLLMMIQGWRRYSWTRMEGVEPFEASQPIEEGILIDGKVISLLLKKQMKDIEVLFWMLQESQSFKGKCQTDENGDFNFLLDMYGNWDLNLQTTNKDKRREYRILLNRAFTPTPRSYTGYDKEVWLDNTLHSAAPELDSTALLLGEIKYTTEVTPSNKEGYKEYTLKEVVKTAKRRTTLLEDATRNASINYNVGKISDSHRDIGESQASDIMHMLQDENPYFSISLNQNGAATYRYKGRPVRFILNKTQSEFVTTRKIEELQEDDVEKVMIMEDREIARAYYPLEDREPVLIFLFTFKDGTRRREPIGIRRTVFQGYSMAKEFYTPVYQTGVPIVEADHRRTLYWNPDLRLDNEGKSMVQFYNNSSCKKLIISAEGISDTGSILVY